MKKVSKVFLALMALIMLLLAGTALAEAPPAALPASGAELPVPAVPYPVEEQAAYSWGQLATVTGATAAVLLIVQYIKLPIDKVFHVPTRMIVYVISLLIIVGAQAFTAGLTMKDLPLLAINAFVVALAAMGSYELTFNRDGNG